MRIYFLICCFWGITVQAQIDTLFWFAAPEVTHLHGDEPLRLIISSYSEPAEVQVSMPANPLFTPINVSLIANNSTILDLSPYKNVLENAIHNQVVNTGLKITSTSNISVYYEVLGSNYLGVVNTDIFVLKGNNALGKTFYVPFQNKFDNEILRLDSTAWASCEIVATEHNTEIEIFPTADLLLHGSQSFSITLQQGEVYSIRAASAKGNEKPIATKIVANKPVAVSLKDDSVKESPASQGYDLMGDQLIPLEYLGMEYVVRSGYVFIISTENNTQLSLNGQPEIVLNEGESHTLTLQNQVHYIEATAPIVVFQVISLGGELGGAVIPQVNCTGSNTITFTRSTDEAFYLDLIAKKGAENDFTINGKKGLIRAGNFIEVPSTNGKWVYASIPFFNQEIIKTGAFTVIQNDNSPFHLGIINGDAGQTGARYGFFSNFGKFDLGTDLTLCGGEKVTLSGGLGRDFYHWNTGENSSSIEITQTGMYKLETQEGANCHIEDSIFIKFHPKPQVSLTYNNQFCEGDSVQVFATAEHNTYHWHGSVGNDSSLVVKETGNYFVEVSDSNACTAFSDTASIKKLLLPRVDLGADTLMLCAGSSLNFSFNPQFDYLWENGDISNRRSINEAGHYHVTASNFCGLATDEVTIKTWNISYPNIITPNHDGKNDAFVVKGIEEDNWKLKIVNRYGKVVYETENYENNYTAQNLNDGIYYFTLQQSDACNTFNGWLQVIR